MNLKVLVISLVCFTFYVQPAHGDLVAAKNAIKGLITIVPEMIIDKTKAIGRATADMASIVTMGTGLEISELGKAASSFKGAVADGLYAIGNSISKVGNTITGAVPNYNPPSGRVVEEYIEPCGVSVSPCDQEVVQFKYHPSKHIYNNAPLVWRALRNRSKGRAYRGGKFVNFRRGVVRRVPVTYEIINTPQVYPGPRGTFYIEKK